MMRDIVHKIKRKWMKIRLQPIRVFCFHQTSETYDPEVYCKPDWIPLDFLKNYVLQLQAEGYKFISLAEAQAKIANDKFRIGKYAVLTADDGLKCQLELVPWLEEQHIPITLFLNLETLDGQICGCEMKKYFNIKDKTTELKHAKELYITNEEMKFLSPLVSIGMHGVNHNAVHEMSDGEFRNTLSKCMLELGNFANYIPFYAYTYGIHNNEVDDILHSANVIPVLADGGKNYNDGFIHREIFEYIYQNRKESNV